MSEKILLRVPRSLKLRLQKEARQERRSLSDHIRLLLAKKPDELGRDEP
jgi:predicted HicB family RNase H-like nuclease